MRVLWALAAEQGRANIVDDIALDNPLAAIRLAELFKAAVGRLTAPPLDGAPRASPGYSGVDSARELPAGLRGAGRPAVDLGAGAYRTPVATRTVVTGVPVGGVLPANPQLPAA